MRLAIVIALLVAGCEEKRVDSATGVCAARVNCPNERAPAKVDECNDAASDPGCGAAYQAYFACFQKNQVCDGRGLVDHDASIARCANLADAWGTCVTPAADTAEPPDTAIEDTFVEPPDTSSDDAATTD